MKFEAVQNSAKSARRHLTKPIQLFILMSHAAAVGREGEAER